MINLPNEQLQQELTSELLAAEGLCKRLLTGLNGVPLDVATSDSLLAVMESCRPLMEQLHESETRLAPLRAAWIQSRLAPDGMLSRLLKSYELVLKTLIDRIGLIEQKLKSVRTEAAPEMDRHVKHQQMQRAYQSVAR